MDIISLMPIMGIGFIAQVIDGSMGMGYGVIANTLLLSLGFPPSLTSATIHTTEVATSGVSAFSHFRFGNVDKSIFKKLILPGMIGGIIGAYILTIISVNYIKSFVSLYLLLIGIFILLKAFKKASTIKSDKTLFPLGFVGGFFDSIGGGGWGPIVTSSLIGRGHKPRFAIGSTNSAEFLVTLVQAGTFLIILKTIDLNMVIGLLIGGVIGAPIGAYFLKKIPPKTLMILAGALIIILSIRTLYPNFL